MRIDHLKKRVTTFLTLVDEKKFSATIKKIQDVKPESDTGLVNLKTVVQILITALTSFDQQFYQNLEFIKQVYLHLIFSDVLHGMIVEPESVEQDNAISQFDSMVSAVSKVSAVKAFFAQPKNSVLLNYSSIAEYIQFLQSSANFFIPGPHVNAAASEEIKVQEVSIHEIAKFSGQFIKYLPEKEKLLFGNDHPVIVAIDNLMSCLACIVIGKTKDNNMLIMATHAYATGNANNFIKVFKKLKAELISEGVNKESIKSYAFGGVLQSLPEYLALVMSDVNLIDFRLCVSDYSRGESTGVFVIINPDGSIGLQYILLESIHRKHVLHKFIIDMQKLSRMSNTDSEADEENSSENSETEEIEPQEDTEPTVELAGFKLPAADTQTQVAMEFEVTYGQPLGLQSEFKLPEGNAVPMDLIVQQAQALEQTLQPTESSKKRKSTSEKKADETGSKKAKISSSSSESSLWKVAKAQQAEDDISKLERQLTPL